MSAPSGGCPRSPRCCALLLVAAAAEIVLDGAAGALAADPEIAADRRLARRASASGSATACFLIALLVSTGAYGGLIVLAAALAPAARCAERATRRVISKRWAIALVAALQLIVFAGPILLSTDVFSYIAYARMGVEHGLNPYLHGPVRDRRRPGLPVRRPRLGPRGHRLRARCTRCCPIRSRRSAWSARCGG